MNTENKQTKSPKREVFLIKPVESKPKMRYTSPHIKEDPKMAYTMPILVEEDDSVLEDFPEIKQ